MAQQNTQKPHVINQMTIEKKSQSINLDNNQLLAIGLILLGIIFIVIAIFTW